MGTWSSSRRLASGGGLIGGLSEAVTLRHRSAIGVAISKGNGIQGGRVPLSEVTLSLREVGLGVP